MSRVLISSWMIAMTAGALLPVSAAAKVNEIKFDLAPNPAVVKCFARYPEMRVAHPRPK